MHQTVQMQVLNSLQKLIDYNKGKTSIEEFSLKQILIKGSFRTKFHLDIKCKYRYEVRILLFLLLIWSWPIVLYKRNSLAIWLLRLIVDYIMMGVRKVASAFSLECKTTVILRWNVRDFDTFLSTLFLLKVQLFSRL